MTTRPRQFSIREMLCWTTVAGLYMAVFRAIEPPLPIELGMVLLFVTVVFGVYVSRPT
jgi:hypothetical protein